MARSIHETTASVVRDYSKVEIDEPGNPGVAALAEKQRYKREKLKSRTARKGDARASSSTGESPTSE